MSQFNQYPVLYFSQDRRYKVVANITKGYNIIVTIKDIPVGVLPYEFAWQLRQVPAPSNGVIDYESGILITSGTGTLSSNNVTEQQFTIVTSSNLIEVNKSMSLTYSINQPSQAPIKGCEVLFFVGAKIPNTVITPNDAEYNDTQIAYTVLNNTQVTAINGAGINLSTLTGGGIPSVQYSYSWEFYKNGVLMNPDEYIVTGSNFRVASSVSNFNVGDVFHYRFII